MTGPPHRYAVTVTLARGGGHLPDPGEYARDDGQAASPGGATIMTARTAGQIISIVTGTAAGQPAAVSVALAVVSEALRRPVSSSTR